MAAVAAVTAEFGLALETACQRLVDAAGMEVAAAAAVPGFGLLVVAAVAGVAVVAAAAAAAAAAGRPLGVFLELATWHFEVGEHPIAVVGSCCHTS